MFRRSQPMLATIMLFLVATGCHSIHSSSVRDLIQLEGTKIDAAQTHIDLFQKETEARIKFLEQARSSLHESFKSLQIQETKHRFALASFRNVTNKKGDSAYAAAYLSGSSGPNGPRDAASRLQPEPTTSNAKTRHVDIADRPSITITQPPISRPRQAPTWTSEPLP